MSQAASAWLPLKFQILMFWVDNCQKDGSPETLNLLVHRQTGNLVVVPEEATFTLTSSSHGRKQLEYVVHGVPLWRKPTALVTRTEVRVHKVWENPRLYTTARGPWVRAYVACPLWGQQVCNPKNCPCRRDPRIQIVYQIPASEWFFGT